MSASRQRGRRGAAAGLANAATRGIVGLLFVGHGLRKLTPALGGPGLEGATAQMEGLGLRPARANALSAATTQLAGGALLTAGLLTPVASAAIAGNMFVAMRTSCAGKGPWGVNGGWEYPLVLAAAALGLAEHGPGPMSLDRALGSERNGPAIAAASLAAALASAAAVLRTGSPG
jgi:putative oxidoreductase